MALQLVFGNVFLPAHVLWFGHESSSHSVQMTKRGFGSVVLTAFLQAEDYYTGFSKRQYRECCQLQIIRVIFTESNYILTSRLQGQLSKLSCS